MSEVDDQAEPSRKKRKGKESEESMEASGDVGDRHHNEEELSERLEKTIDCLVNEKVYLPFFRDFDEKTNAILAVLGLEHLDGDPTEEIKQGLDSEKVRELGLDTHDIKQLDSWEERKNIADFSIPNKIKYLEDFKERLVEEGQQDETTEERKKAIDKSLKILEKHLKLYILLKEIYQEKYEKLGKIIEKWKDNRNKLRNLPNLPNLQSKLAEQYKLYLAFCDERPLSSPSTRRFLLREALKRYEAELGPDVVSPLILSRKDELVELADEAFYDEKIAEMQEWRKRVAEDLDLEDYDSHFFPKSQRQTTQENVKIESLELKSTCVVI